jgi:hypothetical protein
MGHLNVFGMFSNSQRAFDEAFGARRCMGVCREWENETPAYPITPYFLL